MFGHAIMVGRPPQNKDIPMEETDNKKPIKTWKMTVTYLPRRNVRWQAHFTDETCEDFKKGEGSFRFFDVLNNGAITKLRSNVLDQCSIVFEKIVTKEEE